MHVYVSCTDGNLLVQLDTRTLTVTVTTHTYTNLSRDFRFPNRRSLEEVRYRLTHYSSGIVDGTHRLDSYASIAIFVEGLRALMLKANQKARIAVFTQDLVFTEPPARRTTISAEVTGASRRNLFFPENFPKLVVRHDHTKPATQSLIDQLGD